MNLEARQCQCTVELPGLSVACDDAPSDIAAGRCSRATTERVIPLHPRATVLTDLRDHAVRLMKRRGRHRLGRGCNGQSRCNSDQSECGHVSLLFKAEASQLNVGRLGRLRCREGIPAPRGPHLRLEGGACRRAMRPLLYANEKAYKELVKIAHLARSVGILCDAGSLMQNHVQ